MKYPLKRSLMYCGFDGLESDCTKILKFIFVGYQQNVAHFNLDKGQARIVDEIIREVGDKLHLEIKGLEKQIVTKVAQLRKLALFAQGVG